MRRASSLTFARCSGRGDRNSVSRKRRSSAGRSWSKQQRLADRGAVRRRHAARPSRSPARRSAGDSDRIVSAVGALQHREERALLERRHQPAQHGPRVVEQAPLAGQAGERVHAPAEAVGERVGVAVDEAVVGERLERARDLALLAAEACRRYFVTPRPPRAMAASEPSESRTSRLRRDARLAIGRAHGASRASPSPPVATSPTTVAEGSTRPSRSLKRRRRAVPARVGGGGELAVRRRRRPG